jgi:outer membrane receptor protein involved in Fe transport
VIDAHSLKPVEYANMILLDTLTKKMVTGMISDSNGLFKITNVPVGIYLVEYSFIGYEKQRSGPVVISKKSPKADMGTLKLGVSAITMNEVNITAEKSMMINKIDRKVFNVQKDIQAQTGTVTDILQTIPSVSVDMDGNISLRGSGNVTVLINGRPSVMAGAANLEQMPASLIEKIEVITNPSAKYKPDGAGGIINIILKKEKKAGFNGIIGANVGSNDRYNGNLQLNMNTGKVNLFGSYGFRQDYRKRTSDLHSQTIDTATGYSSYLVQTSEGYAKPLSHLGQLGIDWTPSNKDGAGISGTFNYRKVNRDDITDNTYKDSVQQPTEIFTRNHDGIDQETSLGMKAYYEHTFNRETEHQLKIDFEYQGDAETEHHLYTNFYTLPALPDARDTTFGKNNEQNINLSVNYSRPLWKDAQLEAGYEGNMQLTSQLLNVGHWSDESQQWIADGTQTNDFYSRLSVHAAYATVTGQWKKFSAMLGLRAEEALVYLEFKTLDTTTNTNYFALYPTIHLSLASGKNEWQLNYSRRVNRPDGEDMNPVPEYRDPRNIFVGNPDLLPEDIHSLEFGYAFKPDNFTFIPTLFYRKKVNGFAMVTNSLNDSVLVTTIDNLATDQSAGLDLSGTWQFKKIMNLNFSASGFYSEMDASNIGYSEHKTAFSWNAKLNASFNITRTTIFQLNAQYRSAALTAQGMREPTWVANLGFRQDLWKKKVSLLLTVSDLFNTQSMKTSVNTPVLVQESLRRRDARVIYVGAVFNFGSNGKKTKDSKFEFDNGMDR